jgi:hypothetical protein
MNEIALVTANFGAADDVKALPEHGGIDAFYFTDEATKAGAEPDALASWTKVIVPNYPRYDFDARLRSRYFKHQIHRIDEVRKHRWLVWCDSSILLFQTGFIAAEVAKLARRAPNERALLVPHPHRKTVREEYEFIKAAIEQGNVYLSKRYKNEKMTEQIEWFRARGWNVEARLFAGGFWIMENTDLYRRCWDDWWDQNLRFGMMDQLSLPVLMEQHGIVAQALEVLLWQNDYWGLRSKRFKVI